jgi:hypothetical protein
MDARTAYERYLASGPDSLGSMDDVMAALDFGDTHPTEALSIRNQHEQRLREERARDLLRETYIAQGGDASTFAKHYQQLRDEQGTESLRELDHARTEFARSIVRGF